MAGKRKDIPQEMSGREKKKQKTAIARTIAVQPSTSGSATQNAVAGPSKAAHFDAAKGLPGSLDVERFAEARAFEINAMHTAMQNARADTAHRAWQQLPRHLRRRAASHDVRRVPLRLRDKAKAEMDTPKAKPKKHIPQRGQAKREQRTEMLLKRQRDKVWLESHIWHAKRMHMENMWGYRLAVTPTEKSFRPSHRASVHGSILHDASYLGLIEIKGPERVIRSIFDRCCDFQGPSACAKRFSSGARVFVTHFYRRDSYPFNLIAPVQILWRPLATSPPMSGNQQSATSQIGDQTSKQKRDGKTEKTASQPSEELQRTVWLWIHPSVFDEVFQELCLCASLVLELVKKANPSSSTPSEVEIADLRRDLNVFEIMGPKASQVIHGALNPVIEDGRNDFKKCWSSLANLRSAGSVPRNTVIGFKVLDPRLSFPPKNATVSLNSWNVPSSSAAATGFYPTSSLAHSDIWNEEIRQPLQKPKFKKSEIDQRRSQNLIPGTPLQSQRQDDRIPMLMIQRSVENSSSQTTNSPFSATPSVHGWTLIIPAGWSMAFFPSLIHTGTRVGGQRERQTQAFESSSPCFPRDYPSTSAYNDFADKTGKEEQERWNKKPRAKRPAWEKLGVRSPWKPDWEVVLGLAQPEPFEEKPSAEDGHLLASDRDERDLETENAQPAADSVAQDAVDLERSKFPSGTEQHAVTEDHQTTCRPWLYRGMGVAGLIASLAASNSTAASRSNIIFHFIDASRKKRNNPRLNEAAEDYDFSHVSPKDLYRSALVRIGLRLLGRGCPSDMAIIYEMSDEEVLRSSPRTAFHHDNELMEEDMDKAESISIPPQESIIGYVTTGSYSLSLGEGSAIGAVPLAKLVDLQIQAKRLGQSAMTAKVRDRHDVTWRAAQVLLMED
ncbi:NUC188 domain-containing protein [Cytidiella melzeri]|nr:NUC188 domain-containing protein [Cytidiella melzeri]